MPHRLPCSSKLLLRIQQRKLLHQQKPNKRFSLPTSLPNPRLQDSPTPPTRIHIRAKEKNKPNGPRRKYRRWANPHKRRLQRSRRIRLPHSQTPLHMHRRKNGKPNDPNRALKNQRGQKALKDF